MATPAARPGFITAFKIASHAVTLLVILQAVLAGMFISGEQADAEDQHELMSNVIVVAVVIQLLLAFLVRGWSQFQLMYWVGVLLVLSVAQVALGYASEDNSFPEAIHIPLGVFLFGLAFLISALAFLEGRLRDTAG